jgi:hypothetical protein
MDRIEYRRRFRAALDAALEMYRYRILLRERQRDVRGEVICAICGEPIERADFHAATM